MTIVFGRPYRFIALRRNLNAALRLRLPWGDQWPHPAPEVAAFGGRACFAMLCLPMESPHFGTWFVAVGASGAEGLGDIKQLMQELPRSLPAVVLIVLHRPWGQPSHLRSVLAKVSKMTIHIAVEGERFETGNAYIGEPGKVSNPA